MYPRIVVQAYNLTGDVTVTNGLTVNGTLALNDVSLTPRCIKELSSSTSTLTGAVTMQTV